MKYTDIKSIRGEITQLKFAEIVGFTPSYICKLEEKERNGEIVSKKTYDKILEAYRVFMSNEKNRTVDLSRRRPGCKKNKFVVSPDVLRAMRDEKRMSRRRLAALLGVSGQTITNREQGVTAITQEDFLAMREKLGL